MVTSQLVEPFWPEYIIDLLTLIHLDIVDLVLWLARQMKEKNLHILPLRKMKHS